MGSPSSTTLHHLCRGRRRRRHQPRLQREPRPLGEGVVNARRHHPQLRGRCDPVDASGSPTRRRSCPATGGPSRWARRRAIRGPSRTWGSSTTRPRWSIPAPAIRTRPRTPTTAASTTSCRTSGASSFAAGSFTCSRSRSSPTPISAAALPLGTTWDVQWVPIADPTAATHVHVHPGRGARRRALPPPRGRLVGRPHGILPVHRRGQPAGGAGLRVTTRGTRPSSSIYDAPTLQRLRQSGQHDRDAARRPTPVRGQRRRPGPVSGRRAAAWASRSTAGSSRSRSTTWCWLRRTTRRCPPATTARTSGRGRATAPTASGCSRTSRRPQIRRDHRPLRGAGPL